jgi:hypothetical protein
MEVVVYGRLSIRRDALDGLTFEEAKKQHSTIKETLLLGAWKIVNPKGKMKNDPPKSKEEK